MAEWLVERGIGEDRAALIADGAIVAARLCWHEPWRAGAVARARLDHRHPGTRRGAVRLDDGTIAAIDALPAAITTGSVITVRITRAALAESGRFKLAQCRPAPDARPAAAPDLADSLRDGGHPVRVLPETDRALDCAGWDELIESAASGHVGFAGGSLTISPTPAMTLIDIDGAPPIAPLALAAVPAIAASVMRLDLGGSIGIDFPAPDTRAARAAVDTALAAALDGQAWQGERTAMNGFGLVQLISRLERPSLCARFAFHRAAAAARVLLRQATRETRPGALLLVAHPAVHGAIDAGMEAELARRSGRTVRREARSGLALHAGFAQAVAP